LTLGQMASVDLSLHMHSQMHACNYTIKTIFTIMAKVPALKET